jgi:DNA-binding transcriptional ArsR family regulator
MTARNGRSTAVVAGRTAVTNAGEGQPDPAPPQAEPAPHARAQAQLHAQAEPYAQALAYRADISPVAALLADPARAAMLSALLDGTALAAGELSQIAGVSAATASAHLARLLDGGLVKVTQQGRNRYYRLAGHEVAEVIEAISQISPVRPVRSLRQSRQAAALAEARTCYDHLAGRAGVALLDALLRQRVLTGDGTELPAGYQVTAAGEAALGRFGVDVPEVRRSRRRFAAACLDWTQRRPHLSGALGAAITARLLQLGWIEHGAAERAIRVTPAGKDGLAAAFGWAARQ